MQQIIKKMLPFKWIVTLFLATALVWGCGESEPAEEPAAVEEVAPEPAPVEVAPADTLTVDSNATTRPDPRKT